MKKQLTEKARLNLGGKLLVKGETTTFTKKEWEALQSWVQDCFSDPEKPADDNSDSAGENE